MIPERIKILAIDDNPDNLTTLKAVLQEALPSAFLITARSGPEGIELAQTEEPTVILLDIVMPGMDGYEVCRKLKADEAVRLIPVVFATALRTDRESRIKALKAGAEAFLSKPLDEPELAAQIQAMARIRAARSRELTEKKRLAALVAERTRELREELAERKRAETDLTRLKAAIEQSHEAVIITDHEGAIQYVNPAFETVSGFTKSEVPGRNPRFLNSGQHDDLFYKEIWEAITGGCTWQGRMVNRRKDGTLYTEDATISPVRDSSGQLTNFVGI